ncbi:MAG: hypothetical protein GY765_12960 [bacterium]|nr:hypothetical protein [bacterium]
MISVLINDTVVKYLLKQSQETRRRIREKFEFLENGIWDGGLKVKKLKGTSARYIFEARIDRNNRILFTLGHPATGNKEADMQVLLIYVWGIVVHNDVDTKSRTIIPENAPFLSFAGYRQQQLEDTDIEHLEARYFTQEAINEKVNEESGRQQWYHVDEPQWQRISTYRRDDMAFFLHLTPQQQDVLHTPLPLMLSGTAGSGKTSLAVYYLLNPKLEKKKKLFVTYGNTLKNFARKHYNALLNERDWKDEAVAPDFYTFKELCVRAMGPDCGPDAEKEVDFIRFSAMFRAYPFARGFDPVLVWEEIRSIIRGTEPTGNQSKHLTEQQYLQVGNKKAPNFKDNRSDVFKIFKWYQEKLASGGLWDELDALPDRIDAADRYDVVICDEIQDFTARQLGVLFGWAADCRNMLFAGDTHQTVNPSGFRWEEVRNHFYARQLEIPVLKPLTLNLRNSGSIVELSDGLLDLEAEVTGRKRDTPQEEWKYKGRPVTVVSGLQASEMQAILKSAGGGRTVLVRTGREKDALKKALATERVFTIREAKGLEFDLVVLWNFIHRPGAASSSSLSYMERRTPLPAWRVHAARKRYELNLLYVGVTRARHDLIIYDGPEPPDFWKNERFKENIYITGDRAYINTLWQVVTTPRQWRRHGDYFRERHFYSAALECYRNSGDSDLTAEAAAAYHEDAGQFSDAALHFEITGNLRMAAENYEKAGSYTHALELWRELGDEKKAQHCLAMALMEKEEYDQAGGVFEQLRMLTEAVDCYKRSANFPQLARLCEALPDRLTDAAFYYEQAGNPGKAAALYERAGETNRAAEIHMALRNVDKAETLWSQSDNREALKRLYADQARHDCVLAIYEKEGKLAEAMNYLEPLQLSRHVMEISAEVLFEAGRYLTALAYYSVLREHEFVGRCYVALGNFKRAAVYFDRAGSYYEAGDAFERCGNYARAVMSFIKSETDREAGFVRARSVLENAVEDLKNPGDIAMDFFSFDDFSAALVFFEKTPDQDHHVHKGICFAAVENYDQAMRHFPECVSYGELFLMSDLALTPENKAVTKGVGNYFMEIARGRSRVPAEVKAIFLEGSVPEDLMNAYFSTLGAGRDGKNTQMYNVKVDWAYFLMNLDGSFGNYLKVVKLFEEVDAYNELYCYMHREETEGTEEERGRVRAHILDPDIYIPPNDWPANTFYYTLFGDMKMRKKCLKYLSKDDRYSLLFLESEELQEAIRKKVEERKQSIIPT